ncbi:hypothetical protein [Nonomuraea lactucae]|uniref:hypothetical protein n=1 Tax=Nonomuraea lactucae TaxID=2249762 RepID=UPI000DE2A97B|nr:hypothetical protein [Nonomuraea lactucae]
MRRIAEIRGGRREPGNLVFGTIGWLFADLMVALVMAFLVATTVGGQKPEAPPPEPSPTMTPTPTPSPTPTPTPTVEPGIEQRPVKVTLRGVDWAGLLAGSKAAEADLRRKIQAKEQLKDRHAGLVLAFGGGGAQDRDRAQNIARKANAVFKKLGKQNFSVFHGTVFVPYVNFYNSMSTVSLDVYMFKQ